MTRFKHIAFVVILSVLLNGCYKILEPVHLFVDEQSIKAVNIQEDFKVNIESLTFEAAQEANNSPYPRQLIVPGIGSEAKVFNEADFITSSTPKVLPAAEYLLGTGDVLVFNQLNKFISSTAQFPSPQKETDYLLGVGDELTLIQLNGSASGVFINIPNDSNPLVSSGQNENVLKTSGIIGTDGNILLLGLGSIKAKNRSLKNLQTEVRNILIRNGIAPSFQLEITGFNSKKAFISFPMSQNGIGENTVPITNLPISLRELLLNYGFAPSGKDTTLITLKRDTHKFSMTLDQLFDNSTPRILIKDRDQIFVKSYNNMSRNIKATVGPEGNILLADIGTFKAKNRTLAEVKADITTTLLKERIDPNFQLVIDSFKSKAYFLLTPSNGGKVITLDDSELNLREAILKNSAATTTQKDFIVINLTKDGKTYQVPYKEIFNGPKGEILIQDGDTIEVKSYKYKLGQVFALSGAGNAEMIPIDPSKRETLADILFSSSGSPFKNLRAKRSEVYLLRGQNPSLAYHLDTQNVSRILVAAKTELRPNDILYVADRPIISFARTLSEITPLRILLRDIQNNNIP